MLMSDLSSDVDTAYDLASRLSCKSTVGKLSYTRTTDAIYHKLDIAIISWIFFQSPLAAALLSVRFLWALSCSTIMLV